MRRLRFFCFLVGLFSSATSVFAQAEWPLAAVGRIGKESQSGCSATLIEPDLVLTAAHCATEAIENPQDFVFTSGAYPGLPAETVRVARAAAHPFYYLNIGGEVSKIRFDLALLRLETPVSAAGIRPLEVADAPAVGDTIILASYRGGKGERARERKCEIFNEVRDALAIGCEVRGGESGSPIILQSEQGLSVVAVLSSKTKIGEQPIGMAAPIVPRIEPIRDALRAP